MERLHRMVTAGARSRGDGGRVVASVCGRTQGVEFQLALVTASQAACVVCARSTGLLMGPTQTS